MKNLTETQKQLLSDLTIEFSKSNSFVNNTNKFNLIDMTNIISDQDNFNQHIKEIELHNALMKRNAMNLMFEIIEKLRADFKKAGLSLYVDCDEKTSRRFEIPTVIKIKAHINLIDCLFIDFKEHGIFCEFGDRSIRKITGYKYGDYPGKEDYETIQEYLNTKRCQDILGRIYRTYKDTDYKPLKP